MIAMVAQTLLEKNDDLNNQVTDQGDELTEKEQEFTETQRLYNEATQELDSKQNSYEKMEILKADLEK